MISPLARLVMTSGTLPAGTRVLAACSGGADSVALVLLLEELQRAGFLVVHVAHVHHGLRAEADADREIARSLAASLGLPFHERQVDAAQAATIRRRGLEEAARHVRREALAAIREEASCDVIALAHSADDQAETVLMRLLRGAGAEGLAAMAPVQGILVRPLLGVRRTELRRLAQSRGAPWCSDATNWSPSSVRALVRELLERLEASLDDRVVERACETADQLRSESAWLDEQAAALLAAGMTSRVEPDGSRSVRVGVSSVEGAHPSLQRRIIRRLLRQLRPDEPPPSADAVRRALRLFDAGRAPRQARLAGLVLQRVGDEVVAGACELPPPPGSFPLAEGIRVAWGRGDLLLGEAAMADGPSVRLDAASIQAGLLVRSRQPGDVICGTRGKRRISRLLAGAGVPAATRDTHPVVCLAPEPATIVWLAGLEADPRFLADASTQRAVELSWRPTGIAAGAPE